MAPLPNSAGERGKRFVPVDENARRVIAERLDETLFVEASAGTGKTASLVARLVSLVRTGRTTLDRIAAITFTETAAAELRDRVRQGLEEAAADASLGEEEHARCTQGTVDLDQASIQTLHSFASALLHDRPLEAGLPPAFETSDEIAAGLRFDEAWTEWIDAALEEDSPLAPHLGLALTLGVTLSQLRQVAQEFHRNYTDLAGQGLGSPPATHSGWMDELRQACSEMERLCSYSKLMDEDPLYRHVQVKLREIRRLAQEEPGSALAYRQLSRVLPLRYGRGRQGDWDTDPSTGVNACKALKELLAEIQEAGSAALKQAKAAAMTPILDALREFVLRYAERRRAEGRAEFHDLLVWARDLLRDDLQVRDYFRARYSHVLIDEVQDTDPIQTEMAMFLSEAAPEGGKNGPRPSTWDKVLPETGKLFVVGDAKQSIFRFRRADVVQMNRLRDRMERAGGRTLSLVQNFRSQDSVVAWVNHVFEQWMGGDPELVDGDGFFQAQYESMSARWAGGSGLPFGPRVWALADKEVDAPIDGVRMDEAKQIARLLRQMVADEWQTLDREVTDTNGTETYRPVIYSDICILKPTRTGLWMLERALEDQDVPYRLESASLIFETQEIKDLLNCLKAIDDPADQVAIVAALRSLAFGCSDVDLARHYESGGRFDYLRQTAGRGHGPVNEAFESLLAFHAARLWESPGALIDRFVRERGLMEAASGHPRMREQWRRYRFMVERARQFAAAGGTSLRSFLRWVEDQMNERARVNETPVPESDEEAVRVMTVHASKGLEFPVVVLTGINSGRGGREGPVLFDRSMGAVEVGLGPRDSGFATAGYDDLAKREKKMSDAENVRLMYVATTRARDHLVLSLRRPERGGASSPAGMMSSLLQSGPGLWEPIDPVIPGEVPPRDTDRENLRHVDANAEHTVESRERWLMDRERLIEEMRRPSFVSATSLGRLSREDKGEPESPEPWRRGRAGTSVGRAVHAVLQAIDLASGPDIDDRSRAQAAAEGIPEREGEIARLARTAVESEVVKRAVASGRFWREVPVAAAVGGGSLHGFIDLLFEEEDGLVVVDYKTDSVNAAETPDAVLSYRLQGGAYAHAIGQVTGKRVKEVVFLYLQPKREERLEGLAEAVRDAAGEAEKSLGAAASP